MASSPVLRLSARSRPVRAAFLVDPDTLPHEAFDDLIETCMGAWGGGYWPVVPTDGQSISEDYWRLLELTDPDFVTSGVALSDGLRRALEDRLAPARLDVQPVSPDNAHPVVRANWPLSPLGSAGVLRYRHGQAHLFSSGDPLVWFREQHTWGPSANPWEMPPRPTYPGRRFVQRNFGYPRVWWPLEHELGTLPSREVSLVGLTAADALAGLTEGRGLYYRALCRQHAPRPFSPGHVGSPAHVVVVGDAVADAVRAWNRRAASHPSGQTLWVPSALVGDGAFLQAFAAWAERQWAESSGAPRGIHVESSSLDPADLAPLVEALGNIQPVTVGAFDGRTLPFTGVPGTGGSFGDRTPLLSGDVAAVATEGEAAVPTPVPPVAARGVGGAWMVDLDVIDDVSAAPYSNVRPRWRLPRRPDLVRPFLSRGAYPRAYRVVRGGLPSVSATAGAPAVVLRVPEPWAVADALAVTDGPVQGVEIGSIDLSVQGQRFRAATELFGGVYRAGRTLSDGFWRDQLLRAAGDPVASRDEQTAAVRRALVRRGDLTDDRLAAKIASTVHRSSRRTGEAVSKVQLRDAYNRAVSGAYRGEPKDRRPTFVEDGWPRFEWLVERGVFLQGCDLRCPSCGLLRWHPVDDLARTVRCPECLRSFRLPADPGWSFRLNGLVRSALADDAVLPVIDAAYAVAREARTHALVLPPIDLFPPSGPFAGDGRRPFTDLDLFVLRDGQLVVGEVKSSASRFDAGQLGTLGAVATALRADEVVLAAPAPTWTPEAEADACRAVRERLGVGARVRVLMLAPDPFG